MATVALGTMMGAMDASITNISFPILTKTFGVSVTTIVWVSLAYILASTSLMLILGRVGDLLGRKRIYIVGTLIFTIGLALCALSQNVTQLIIFRVFQAVGAAMAMACGAAIITEAFPQNERGMGLGLLAVSVSAGLISGPVLGGFLLGWFHWRSIFYVRIPLGLFVLMMALLFLKKDQRRVEKIKFDLWGTLFSSTGLTCLMFGVNQLNRFGLKSSMFYLLMGLGLLSLIIFVFVEKHALDPIVDLSLLKNRVFACALGSLFLMFLTYSAYILLMPFYLLQGIGMTPSKAGVMMTVVSMIAIIVGPISGWLSDRFGQALFATLGAVLTIISFWLIFGFDLESRIVDIIPALALAGLGMGM
ncbi:MAG: DHA2 family efflux MFS transporter permease subunit, partial [Deltaproteobacteria bacterium]|nr:DHA2 family efflux MFS transporter permease subunit [Deltaproteobacteria bacterium]